MCQVDPDDCWVTGMCTTMTPHGCRVRVSPAGPDESLSVCVTSLAPHLPRSTGLEGERLEFSLVILVFLSN